MWGLHVDYSISAVGNTYEMWQAYLFGSIYANSSGMYV